jgi:hypothetical protein
MKQRQTFDSLGMMEVVTQLEDTYIVKLSVMQQFSLTNIFLTDLSPLLILLFSSKMESHYLLNAISSVCSLVRAECMGCPWADGINIVATLNGIISLLFLRGPYFSLLERRLL